MKTFARTVLLRAIALAVAMAGIAHAKLVTVVASGTIGGVPAELDSEFVSGEPFDFIFTYETATPDLQANADDHGAYVGALRSVSLLVGDYSVEAYGGGMDILNNCSAVSGIDRYAVTTGRGDPTFLLFSGGENVEGLMLYAVSIQLIDLGHTVFVDDSLPASPPQLAAFEMREFELLFASSWSSNIVGGQRVYGVVTDLRLLPTPPTISAIPDQTIDAGTYVGPVPFTIGDEHTPPDDLLLSASSSSQVLVPDSHIAFGGGGADRTVFVMPLADQSGSTTITITVSDGELTATTSFLLTVSPGLDQTIDFPPLPRKTYCDADFAHGATASSGLLVSVTSSDETVAQVAHGMVQIVGAGTCTLTATQGGNDDWSAAAPVLQTLVVAPALLTCTADSLLMEYSQPVPALTMTYAGLVCGDTAPQAPPTLHCDATPWSPAGVYPITLMGGSDPNYEITPVDGVLTIQDTVAPYAVAIQRVSPAATATNWVEVTFSVAFSEPVLGLAAASFAVDATGAQKAAVVLEAVPTGIDWKLVGAADVWSVRVQTAAGDGLLSLDLVNGLAAIQDSGGNALRGPFTAGESYDVDRTPPVLVTLDPANGTDEVPLAPALVVTFSEPVFEGSGSITIRRAADGSIFGAIAAGDLSIAGGTVTLPHAPLVAGSWYHVLMDSGSLVDAKGNPFAGIADPQAWRFRARQWQVVFQTDADGHLEGDTVQRVDQGGSTSPVVAVADYLYVFDRWDDSSAENGANPRTVRSVTKDLALKALFRAAGVEEPDGTFLAVLGSGAPASRKLWDLSGSYSTTAKGNSLTMDLVHDTTGRLVGTATYTVAKDSTVTMPIRGSVKGNRGSITIKGTMRGANRTQAVSVALALNLTLDAANRQLIGRLTGSIGNNGTASRVNEALTLDIPGTMDGTWQLQCQLDHAGRTVAGTATVTLSNDVAHTFLVTGRATGETAVLTLSGTPADPAARAIMVKTTVTLLEGAWARIERLSGKGYGQTLTW